MAEPTLELAPYEIPPQHQSYLDSRVLVFDASCFGCKGTFVGKRVNDGYGNLLFFAVPDEPHRGNFVCASVFERAAEPQRFGGVGREVEIITESIENQAWGRYYVLDNALELSDGTNGSCTLFLCSTGWGTIHSHHEGIARFRWSQPCAQEMWNLSPQAVLSPALKAFREDSSELNFAFRWAKLSAGERLALVYPLQKGNYAEWVRMCELCALASGLWEKRELEKLHYRVEVRGKAFASWSSSNSDRDTHINEGVLHRFALWTHDYFCPTRDDQLCSRYSWADEWANGAEAVFHSHLERPTQHEHLEAMLDLREWLADKATPAEIEELLREN